MNLLVAAIVWAILSINTRTETERILFKVLAILFLLLPLIVDLVTRR